MKIFLCLGSPHHELYGRKGHSIRKVENHWTSAQESELSQAFSYYKLIASPQRVKRDSGGGGVGEYKENKVILATYMLCCVITTEEWVIAYSILSNQNRSSAFNEIYVGKKAVRPLAPVLPQVRQRASHESLLHLQRKRGCGAKQGGKSEAIL